MPRDELTRRSMISLLAGAAAGVTAPGRALAARSRRSQTESTADAYGAGLREDTAGATSQPQLRSIPLGDLPAGVKTPAPTGRFDLVGVSWRGDAGAIELRTSLPTGRWGRWARASALSHTPDGAELSRSRAAHAGPARLAGPAALAGARTGRGEQRVVGDPVWVGDSHTLQLRLSHPVKDVIVHLIDAGGQSPASPVTQAAFAADATSVRAGRRGAHAASRMPIAHPILAAGAGQPQILARSAWAGRSSLPRVAPEYGDVQLAFVHHTENPNGYVAADVPAMLRAIFVFHRDVNGWNDIGYNFVVDLFGRIFEARAGGIDEPVVGAQAGGYNAVSTGVAVLGDFSYQPISEAAAHALERLLCWKLGLHGVPIRGHVTVHVNPAGSQYSRYPANAAVSLPRVAGHRDADATICPGDALYRQLPSLRTRCFRLAGPATRATIQLQKASAEVKPEPSGEPEVGVGGAETGAGSGSAETGAGSGGAETGAGSGGAEAAPEAGGESAEEPALRESSTTHVLAGKLTVPGSHPIAEATVEIQARSVSHRGERVMERTIAKAVTAADGSWSVRVNVVPPPRRRRRKRKAHAPPPPQPVTPVRAVFKGGDGARATVSTPLEVQGTLTVE